MRTTGRMMARQLPFRKDGRTPLEKSSAGLTPTITFFSDALATVREVFLNKPDIDVVYGHAAYLSADGNFQTYFPAISENITFLKRGCIICQPSCFVRREAMERVGGLNTALH